LYAFLAHLKLFSERKHFVVHQNGQPEVEGRWNARDEVERSELARQLLHRENHLVHLQIV
jgi:hypothetical protein